MAKLYHSTWYVTVGNARALPTDVGFGMYLYVRGEGHKYIVMDEQGETNKLSSLSHGPCCILRTYVQLTARDSYHDWSTVMESEHRLKTYLAEYSVAYEMSEQSSL